MDNSDSSSYIYGSLAVNLGIISSEKFEQSCQEHKENGPDMPYETFLVVHSYITAEQLKYIKSESDSNIKPERSVQDTEGPPPIPEGLGENGADPENSSNEYFKEAFKGEDLKAAEDQKVAVELEPEPEPVEETPEDKENLGYWIGLLAAEQEMMTSNQYEESYYAHHLAYSDMPFEVYLIYKGHLTVDQVNYLKELGRDRDWNSYLQHPAEETEEPEDMADGLRIATDTFFQQVDESPLSRKKPGPGQAPPPLPEYDSSAPQNPDDLGMTIDQNPALEKADAQGSGDMPDDGTSSRIKGDIRDITSSGIGTGTSITLGGQGGTGTGLHGINAIEKYEIIDEVARGGMGVIYKALQKDLKRIVALKVMLAAGMSSDQERKRFLREAEVLAHLNHPNIIKVYEIGMFNENYFFSMDFIEGVTLNKYAELQKKPLTTREKCELLVKVLDAVHYGHGKDIIHRDLKPANIMINEHDEPIVMDFGLVKMAKGEDEEELSLLTATGAVMGTPYYMAPEQAAGKKEIDARTDVFALGVIVYELITGERPFTGDNVNEIFDSIFYSDPASPRKVNKHLDWEIEAIVLKSLEKEPAKRYQTALSMKEDIVRYLNEETIYASRISAMYYLKKKVKRHKVMSALICLVVLLTASLIWWGSHLYISKQREHVQLKKNEEKVIEEIHKGGIKLKDEVYTHILEANLLKARETKVALEARIQKIEEIVAGSTVGTEDKNNYTGKWKLELGDLERKIEARESEVEHILKVKKCKENVTEGDACLAKAAKIIKEEKDPEKRGKGKELIQDAILFYDTALAEIPDWEEARKGKFNACMLMGECSIQDKSYDLASLYLRSASRSAKTEKEKKKHFALMKKFQYEKNEMQKYSKYFTKAMDLFSKKDYRSALAQFEVAQNVLSTEEVAREIQKTKYKIEIGKAESLKSRGEYLSAAVTYRNALSFAVDDSAKGNLKRLIDDALKTGSEKKLTEVKGLIIANRLQEAEKTVEEVLSLVQLDEASQLRKKIRDLIALPPNMVYIEGGECIKGTPEKSMQNPYGKVTVDEFYMLKYEVTNHQYKEFVEKGGYTNSKYWDKKGWENIKKFVSFDGKPGPAFWLNGSFPAGKEDMPVNGISFYEACAYAKWLTVKTGRKYELPTEFQWEKASSWDNTLQEPLVYPWGDSWDNRKGNFTEEIEKSGTNRSDISSYGCYDMGGNLHEWVRNSYGTENRSQKSEVRYGVLKGGAAKLPQPLARVMAKGSFRTIPPEGFRGEKVGFRIVTYPIKKQEKEIPDDKKKSEKESKN